MIVSFKDNTEPKESITLSMVRGNGEKMVGSFPEVSNKTNSRTLEKYDLLSFEKSRGIFWLVG
jgi:hypothetical protein